MSERRRFFGVFSDSDVVTCPRCGGRLRRDELARDASRMTGRKSICVPCDREKSRAYYAAHRDSVLARAAAKRPARLWISSGNLSAGSTRSRESGPR